MPASLEKNRFRFYCRRLLRGCGVLLLFILLLSAAGLVYLNWVGVPRMLRAPLQKQLFTRGLILQVGDLRLHGWSRVTARDVRLESNNTSNRFRLILPEAELQIQKASLRRLHIQIESCDVRNARGTWFLQTSNSPPVSLEIAGVAVTASFSSQDHWELHRLTGRFHEIDLDISGVLTNGQALFERKEKREPLSAEWIERVGRWTQTLDQIQVGSPSKLTIHFEADAREMNRSTARLAWTAPRAVTPWGEFETVSMAGKLGPAVQNRFKAEVNLEIARSKGTWGQIEAGRIVSHLDGSVTNRSDLSLAGHAESRLLRIENITARQLELSFTSRPDTNVLSRFITSLRAKSADSVIPVGRGQTNQLTAELAHSFSDFKTIDGHWEFSSHKLESRWGQAEQMALSGQWSPAATTAAVLPRDTAWWPKLQPFQFDWRGEVRQFQSPKLKFDKLTSIGKWQAPHLTLSEVSADLYDGSFVASGQLDVPQRELRAWADLNFDAHGIECLLTTNAQRWLRQFSWDKPPHATAEGRVVLPSWTNAHPDWRAEVLPSLQFAGFFETGPGAFREVPATASRSHFSFTNSTWHLPDLVATRPEGQAELSYIGDMRTHDYAWQVKSRVDPRALKPLLDGRPQRVLDEFNFSETPLIQGTIWGRWNARELIGFNVDVRATNFSFRGETCDSLRAGIQFTNLFFKFGDVRIGRQIQQISVPSAGYDLEAHLLHITNGVSTMDPDVVAKVIGPKVRAVLKPYHFVDPPSILINGQLPTDSTAVANAHFHVAGASFNYWRFNVPEISGNLDWIGETLAISDVRASFYQGDLTWEGNFDFAPPIGTDFQFRGVVTESDLHLLMADLTRSTNRLEGTLEGKFTITSANSTDWKSWKGFGELDLRDGYLWDIPIFGFFSPILNKIVPGLGNSPASAASTTFAIDKSVVHTSDLEIRSPALRLWYEGNVDLHGQVDARMHAEVLRDAWGVGRVVSLALWPIAKIFEYKITGTVSEPKSEPLYIPRVAFWPFRPFRVLRQILTSDKVEKVEPAARRTGPHASP